MDIRSIHTIHTPENLPVEIELAGVGNRIFAFLIDLFMLFILMVFALLMAVNARQLHEEVAMALLYTLPSLVFFGYHFFLEWLWNGKSVGKHLLHLRVVRNNGQPIGVWESFGRNLLRIVDVWLFGIGLIPLMMSRREKRFGDFLAGTVVTNDQKVTRPPDGADAEGVRLERPDVLEPSVLALGERLAPEEYDLLQEFLVREEDLLGSAREQLALDFQIYFQNRLQLSDETVAVENFLPALYYGYRDAMASSVSGTSAPPKA